MGYAGMASEDHDEIVRLYHEEHLTQKKISSRLGIPQQTVSYHLKNPKKKASKKKPIFKRDIVNPPLKTFPQNTKISLKRKWRFHALCITVSPYYFYPRYEITRRKRGNWFTFKDWNIKMHQRKVEFRLRRGYDFEDVDKFEAIWKAEESFNRALYQLANRLGFKYEKEGRISLRIDKQHLAYTNSPVARARKDKYLKIKGTDGKVWFIVDKSKGHGEHEYVHSGRLLEDSHRIEGFFNELRENEDISLTALSRQQEFNTQAMTALSHQIMRHLKVLEAWNRNAEHMNGYLKNSNAMTKKLISLIAKRKI